jgi:Domain of unknown function (DUF932)
VALLLHAQQGPVRAPGLLSQRCSIRPVAAHPHYGSHPPSWDGARSRWRILAPAPNHKATLRSDTGALLGIVGRDYEPLDNRDAFRFLDELIGSQLHFETAGSLWGGRRVWVLARLPEWAEVGGDQTGTYV